MNQPYHESSSSLPFTVLDQLLQKLSSVSQDNTVEGQLKQRLTQLHHEITSHLNHYLLLANPSS